MTAASYQGHVLTREDWDRYRGPLMRFYVDKEADTATDLTQFISAYFAKFLKRGGTSEDHFDLSRMKCDDMGIPQDLSQRYFTVAQKNFTAARTGIEHVPPWLVNHFEYVVQTANDFFNERKFRKLKELRAQQSGLPIAVKRKEIVELLSKHQVLIVAGDTGCGKSTQVPQYLMAAGYTGIACTQPRRLACTALARRVSYETLDTYGSEVAFQIRFESTKTKKTRLLFLTEGLLLRQMESDSLLNNYSVVILDEVHERHLTSDLLLGLLRDLVAKREDLKLVLMSATINLELFAEYFQGAPVIQVPGRLYPIVLHYRPIKEFIPDSEKKSHKINPEPYLNILEDYPSSERGDALIFLNGVAELTTVAEALKTYAELTKQWIVLLLHSTLSVEEQDKVFDVAPPGVRKCILATNVAETSVTIDGVRFVIDSGKVNLVKFDPETKVQKLSEFWVSKASADQRKGRAGRTGPGVCFRLYSQLQYEKMEAFTLSEIKRVSLHEMCLQIIGMNLGLDVRTFPYIERPDSGALDEAIETLKFQGVVQGKNDSELTALGKALAMLPVDIPIGKMLVMGCVFGCVDVVLTVAASLSVQSPFTNRSFREFDLVQRRSRLASPLGDPFTLINVFREWVAEKACRGGGRRWTIENGIDEFRLFEISKLRNQYRSILEQAGMLRKLTDEELGLDDSRQRRIRKGEERKLFEMKKQARMQDKSRKMLKADRHFDRILEEKEEADAEAEVDPLKADVKTVEFLLEHRSEEVEAIHKTHKLTRRETEVLEVIIALGLYPQFALLDQFNKYQHGQELFAHTRLKPFSQLHPNGTMAQYHPEALENGGRDEENVKSSTHQIPFYGLFLETTKPYLCNVMPLPALALSLVAKKVICEEWKLLTIDDFVEIEFVKEEDCKEVLSSCYEVRKRLAKSLGRKLRGADEDESETRELRRAVERFMSLITHHAGIPVSMRRLVSPPRVLENVGLFDPNGEVEIPDVELFEEEDEGEEEEEEEPNNEAPKEQETVPLMGPLTQYQQEDRETAERDAQEKSEKCKPKKESYYERLLRMQGEEGRGNEEKKKISTQQDQDPMSILEKRIKLEQTE